MGRSMFAGIGGARQGEGSGTGKYVAAGRSTLLIKRVLDKPSERKRGKNFFVVEAVVLGADLSPTVPEAERYARGEQVSFIRDFSRDGTVGDVNGFICGVMGCEPDDVTEELAEQLVGETQPLAGMVVRTTATSKKNNSNDNYWTTVFWEHVEPSEQAQLKQAFLSA